jgi:hypothetical protein
LSKNDKKNGSHIGCQNNALRVVINGALAC